MVVVVVVVVGHQHLGQFVYVKLRRHHYASVPTNIVPET